VFVLYEVNKCSIFDFIYPFLITYSGLPPSPPSNVYGIDVEPYPGHDNNGTIIKPLGVDVSRKQKEGSGGRMLIMIILSSFTAFLLFIGLAWIFLLKCGSSTLEPGHIPDAKISSSSMRSGNLKASEDYLYFSVIFEDLISWTTYFMKFEVLVSAFLVTMLI